MHAPAFKICSCNEPDNGDGRSELQLLIGFYGNLNLVYRNSDGWEEGWEHRIQYIQLLSKSSHFVTFLIFCTGS